MCKFLLNAVKSESIMKIRFEIVVCQCPESSECQEIYVNKSQELFDYEKSSKKFTLLKILFTNVKKLWSPLFRFVFLQMSRSFATTVVNVKKRCVMSEVSIQKLVLKLQFYF